MKNRRLLMLVAGLVPAFLCSGLLPRAAANATAPPAQEKTFQELLDEFNEKFALAIKVNDKGDMAGLVKRYESQAVHEIIGTCLSIETGSSEELEVRILALADAWHQAKQSSFGHKMWEFYSLQTTQMKQARQKLQNQYAKALNRHYAAVADEDGPTIEAAAAAFEGLAKAYDDIGDRFHASACWYQYAVSFDEEVRGDDANLDKAFEGFKKARDLRERIELSDPHSRHALQRMKLISSFGYGEELPELAEPGATDGAGTPGADPSGSAEPASAPAVVLSAAMSFDPIEKMDRFARPSYYADEFHVLWPEVGFAKKGSTSALYTMEDSPTFYREGFNEITIDTDADGAGNLRIPITGNVNLVEFEIGDEFPRKWAFLTTIGTDKDHYQGLQVNMQPDDNQFRLFVAPAASVVGVLGEVPVRVFDDNMDGVYGSYPRAWHPPGLVEGSDHPLLDSILVGDEDQARPWSHHQNIGGQWYTMEALEGGTRIVATPAKVKTGRLRLKFKGGKPSFLVLTGLDRVQGCYFDLVGGGSKGVEVPVGKYMLYYGELRKGKRLQMMKSLILPGPDTKKWSVSSGEEVEVELGSPFGFDFTYKVENENLVIRGESIVITGVGEERYGRPWNCRPEPEAAWRKAGSKRGGKPDKMDFMNDVNQINTFGFQAAWHPFDATIKLGNAASGGVEVQLVQKKNKLFGKIESAWK